MRTKTMKKLVATVCLLGSVVALAACESTGEGYVDTQPPYASERTAGATQAPVQSAEPVFEKKVTK
jgi:hypothetical protein